MSTRRESHGPSPARRAWKAAAVWGGIAFVAGYAGPLLLSPSRNLGPLLGIFYTGPLGALAGALWSVTRSARMPDATGSWNPFAALVILLLLNLLYILFMFAQSAAAGFPGVVALGFVIAASALSLVATSAVRAGPPGTFRAIMLAAMILLLLLSLFPPAKRPWWVPPEGQGPEWAAPVPSLAFVLDRRFIGDPMNAEITRRYPSLMVDRWALVGRYGAVLLAAVVLGLALRRRHASP